MPNFTEFSREDARSSREGAMFTLQARGLVSLNHAAFQALGEPAFVALLYDADEGIVAMRKVPQGYSNAYAVRKQQSQSYLVGAQAFTSYHRIPTQRARRFPGHDYGRGIWGFALSEGTAVQNRRGGEPGPAITDRWRHTTDGFEVSALMNMTHIGMSHPGYMLRPNGTRPPWVRVGMQVACESLGPAPTTSDLRSRFLGLLSTAPVMGLITELSYIDGEVAWAPWGGRGRFNLEAALAGDDEKQAPVASALLLLPEEGISRHGRDSRAAQFVLDIEPRNEEGAPAPPVNLAGWNKRFARTFTLPALLAHFLANDLGLSTSDDPPAQAGIWLNSPGPMTELVDTENLTMVRGATPSNQFMGWAVADPSGKMPGAVALDLLTQLCDHTLHLDGYESVLTPSAAASDTPHRDVTR